MPKKTGTNSLVEVAKTLNEFCSRSDERQERFYLLAEKKELASEEIMYPSEVNRLLREGFQIEKLKDFNSKRALAVYNVSWANPFPNGIPHIVYSYITGILSSYPKSKVTNFAQELFVIARRASS